MYTIIITRNAVLEKKFSAETAAAAYEDAIRAYGGHSALDDGEDACVYANNALIFRRKDENSFLTIALSDVLADRNALDFFFGASEAEAMSEAGLD